MGFGASQLPKDLWVEILSRLMHEDLGRALCTCRALAGMKADAWKAACYRKWPYWASIVSEADADWRRLYEFCSLREAECAALPDVDALLKRQSVIADRHRSILTEWICEVSHDWNLESSTVFHAVRYLDHYLEANTVADVARFQLIGLACLRVAMRDHVQRSAAQEPEDKALDAARFANISDNTYTAAEVEETTQIIESSLTENIKEPPNSKQFLRSFWQCAIARNIVTAEDMHIYFLAAFLLQLALVHLPASAFPPSQQAAAALSLAFTAFGLSAWPTSMQSFGSYASHHLQECRAMLAQANASRPADQLRRIWRRATRQHGYATHEEEWSNLHKITCRSTNILLSRDGKSAVDDAVLMPTMTPETVVENTDAETRNGVNRNNARSDGSVEGDSSEYFVSATSEDSPAEGSSDDDDASGTSSSGSAPSVGVGGGADEDVLWRDGPKEDLPSLADMFNCTPPMEVA